ncbi:MAG: hypothetical protein ACREIA_20780 [Opitutaceae bacterium]
MSPPSRSSSVRVAGGSMLPGGVLVITREGKHIGAVLTERNTANCAFGGGADGTWLYITANDALLRIKTRVTGAARAPGT